MRIRHQSRSANGSTIAETAAAMGILIPLIFAILFVVAEVSQAYLIKESLSQSAREAARQMAICYGQDQQIKTNRKLQERYVFDQIRIANIVNSSQQFANPVWDVTGSPPTVSVTVSYTSGKNGLPVFPAPDPLSFGSKFNLVASSVYRIE